MKFKRIRVFISWRCGIDSEKNKKSKEEAMSARVQDVSSQNFHNYVYMYKATKSL